MTKWKLRGGVCITFVLVALVIVTLILNQELFPVYLSIMASIITLYTAQILRESYHEKNLEKLLAASKRTLAEELTRNYCTADIFEESLLSTMAWDNVVASGLALRLGEEEFERLMRCYSVIRFYNHDISSKNPGPEKQKRVKIFIKKALSAIDSECPTTKKCCENILPDWSSPEKLKQACESKKAKEKED